MAEDTGSLSPGKRLEHLEDALVEIHKRLQKIETDNAVGRLKLALVIGGICMLGQAAVSIAIGLIIWGVTKS